MGQTKNHPSCIRFAAVFSGNPLLIEECWGRLERVWGPIAVKSTSFDFLESEYYQRSMGLGLKKQLALFSTPYDPSLLSEDKQFSNRLERSLSERVVASSDNEIDNPLYGLATSVQRPINIDPGYMSLTKLVLASTKNREHRIYLRDGIYAEVTLAFRDQAWQVMPWTYADYQREDFRAFLASARKQFATDIHDSLLSSKAIPPARESHE
jgi:hypothetical protein